ncbi:MAG: adenylosuccinate lyase [Actinobacteria bacterium]|nr:adenylosuccinate lyase [Actinomycetota bacterium]
MIARYSLPEMAAIFADEARFARYLEIELLALEAQAEIGTVPAAAAAACRARAPRVDAAFVAAVAERERTTDHDVAAFVDVAQSAIGMPDGAWLHHGLTSSDVVDTAWCAMLRDAADLILAAADGLIAELVALARRHADTPMMGRTHGMHAELTTFGTKVALWALQVDRDRVRLRAARGSVAVCKVSGAVGTYSNVDPRVEQFVAARLGLRAVPSTQVVARDRHAEYLWACASLGTTIGSIATELRHLQRSEVGEVREGFKPGQKGSSAMPHKRNPISAETLTGLSRLLRANAQAGLENVALWHERDISHSSVERVVLPDSSLLAHYATVRLTRLVASLEVDAPRMAATIESSRGLAHSQAVLLALVAAGKPRDEAYRTVQDASARAVAEGRHLREVLESSADLPLGPAELTACFDQAAALRHARRAVDALDGLV